MAFYNNKKSFPDAAVGSAGCVYKAALTSSTVDSADGLGVDTDGNDWIVSTGIFTFSSAGMTKPTDTGGGIAFDVPTSTAMNPNLEAQMGTRGAMQFEFKVPELLRTDPVGLKTFFQMTSSAQANSFFTMRFYYIKDNLVYTRLSQDVDGNWVNGPAPTLQARSETVDGNHYIKWLMLDTSIETDSDGMATMGISWTGQDIFVSINGTPVIWMIRNETQAPNFTQFNVFAGIIGTMRNLLIYDRPFANPNNPLNRIAHVGHSFIQRMDSWQYHDRSGEVGLQYAHCGVQQLTPQLYKSLEFPFEMRSFSASSVNLSDIDTRYLDTTATVAYDKGGTNYTQAIRRFKPHFVLLTCAVFGPGASYANRKTGIHTISQTLMNLNIIPVWILEGENLTTSNAVGYAEALAEVQRQQAANDMGLVDIRATIGTSDRSYIEYHTGESGDDWHPNNKQNAAVSPLIAAEISRLYGSPPAYSRYSTKSAPNAIAAP